jgi:CheY-like chemotaxis protein
MARLMVPASVSGPTSTPATVLVIDDQRPAGGSLRRVLHAAGYDTLSASSAQEALPIVAEDFPSAIVLNLLSPVIDGSAFLTQLRGLPTGRTLPVLMVSAFPLPRLAATYGVAILLKPFTESVLLDHLRLLLD